jgi:hypothetical protein
MSDFNSAMTIPLKVDDSLELSTLQGPYDTEEHSVSDDATTRQELKVNDLNLLPDETFKLLLSKRGELERKITSGFAEQAIPAGIYKVDGQTNYVCPEAFFNEDNIIGQMIVDFARETGAVIRIIKAPVGYTTLLDEKFISGAWLGMYSSTNQKRRRGKRSYEMGRTCTFALIVKNMFEITEQLGPRALMKDQLFFGNNEGEMFNKSKVVFHIKTRLCSFFDDPKWGNLIYGIINHTACHVGFSYLTLTEQDKVINDHLIPIDRVITMCYPRSTLKRGRTSIQKVKKPNPIRTSPLYLREEMELISLCSSRIFSEFVDVVNTYETSVFALGFVNLESRIREVIRLRWETLQRFANRTKLRLQTIRKIVNNPTLKKANVVPDNVNPLLKSYQDPALNLVIDIKHILGGADFKECLSVAFKRDFSTFIQAETYLYIKALELYKIIIPDAQSMKTLQAKPLSEEPSEMDYGNAVKAFIRVQNEIGNLRKQSLNFQNIQSHKIPGRTRNIAGLYKNIDRNLAFLTDIPSNASDLAVSLISDGNYKTYQEYLEDIFEKLFENRRYLVNAGKTLLHTKLIKSVKDILDQFLQALSSIDFKSLKEKVID